MRPGGQQMTEDADTSALEAAIRRFGEAWAQGDRPTLESLLSPTYTHTDIFGRIQDRSGWLAYVEGRRGARTRVAFEDLQTRITGEVAVVTGRNIIHGNGNVLRDGRENRAIRFTQVWMRPQESWLREAFQGTTVFGEHVPDSPVPADPDAGST